MFKSKERKLNDKIYELKKELEDFKIKKVIDERDLKHLIKIKEEKIDIENEKKQIKLEREYQEKEMALKGEFHSKYLDLIEGSKKDLQKIHMQIMDRLPKWETRRVIREEG